MTISTMRAILARTHGGPDVLEPDTVELDAPPPGALQIRQAFAGVNFIDTYHRTGFYPCALPLTPGVEASGTVVAVGDGVDEVWIGRRVAYVSAAPGAYAMVRNVPAAIVVALPDDLALDVAAALMVRGMTAEYLLFRTFEVGAGSRVLVHAAAGGMGLLLGAWARALGATRVIGTVSTEAKAELAAAHGYTDLIRYRDPGVDVAARVRELTDGDGVDVVYDGVGASTFDASLASLRRRGLLVSFGQSSGAVPPVDVGRLSRAGSLFLTRPTLYDHIATRDDLELSAGRVFDAVASGAIEVQIGQRYPLDEAARAHADLEARRTVGSTVLEM